MSQNVGTVGLPLGLFSVNTTDRKSNFLRYK